MARPKKATSYEEEMARIDAKIEKLSAELKAVKDEKKDLETRKQEQDKAELLNAISSSGKSAEEILAFLNK